MLVTLENNRDMTQNEWQEKRDKGGLPEKTKHYIE